MTSGQAERPATPVLAGLSAGPGDWLHFGPFSLSAARGELRRSGHSVELGRRGMALLVALLSSAGRPVSKAELIRAAWGTRAVEASNLTVQVAKLRQALAAGMDGAATTDSFIQTVPGYGYVFTSPIGRDRVSESRPGPPMPRLDALTRFIGREQESRELTRILQAQRLVTVAGMGGVGKTRLVVQLQRELAPLFPEGVVFADLAPLLSPDQVRESVAIAVGAGSAGTDVDAALMVALRGRRMLLILDNAEHVAEAVARLAGAVLAACDAVSIVVTSRESLGIPGEVVFRLRPMAVPPDGPPLSAAEALGFDCVRLFADRARSLLPGFEVSDENAADIADICRRLDGIALAVEMAVPRLEVLTPRQLAGRLQDRFGALAPLRHGVLPRQRTLRAMFDWSWELLSPRQRAALQLLAVFPAGSTLGGLEAAAAADGASGPGAAEMLDHLTALAQKSLVLTLPAGAAAEARYQLLETTRQYALGQLSTERRDQLDHLVAVQMAMLFELAEAEWPVTHGSVWVGRYGPEANNLRAVLQWAFARPGHETLALRLAAASVSLWWELPGLPLREGRRWFTLATGRITPDTPPAVAGRLLFGQSWTDTIDGDVENFPGAFRAAALFREARQPVWLGAALWRAVGTVMGRLHEPSGAAMLGEALQALKEQPATKWRALCHVRQADLLHWEGDLLPALAEYDVARALIRSTGHGYGLLLCEGNRAYLLFQLGRQTDAIEALQTLHDELPGGLQQSVSSLLATLLVATDRKDAALVMLQRNLTGIPGIGMSGTLSRSIEALALLLGQGGDLRGSAQLLGFVERRHAADRKRLGPRAAIHRRLTALLQDTLEPAALERLLHQGAAWTEDEAVAMALASMRLAA